MSNEEPDGLAARQERAPAGKDSTTDASPASTDAPTVTQRQEEVVRVDVSGDIVENRQILRFGSPQDRESRFHSPATSTEHRFATGAVLIARLISECRRLLADKKELSLDHYEVTLGGTDCSGGITNTDAEYLGNNAIATDRHVVTGQQYHVNHGEGLRYRVRLNLGLELVNRYKGPKLGNNEADVRVYNLCDVGSNRPQLELTPGRYWTIVKVRCRKDAEETSAPGDVSYRERFSEPVMACIKKLLDPGVGAGQSGSSANSNSIILLDVADLRKSGIPVSYEISWERTLQQIILWFEELQYVQVDQPFFFLREAKHIVVSLAPDAVVYLSRKAECFSKGKVSGVSPALGYEELCRYEELESSVALLVYEPTSIEGDLGRSIRGYMRGFNSLIAASLALRLSVGAVPADCLSPAVPRVTHPYEAITTGLTLGLKAARVLAVHGFEPQPRKREYPKALDFPVELLAHVLSFGSVDGFPSGKNDPKGALGVLNEWKAAGWVHQHRIRPRFVEELVQRARANWQNKCEREAHYRASFWTLRESATGEPKTTQNRQLCFKSGSTPSDLSAIVLTELAIQTLVMGPGFLTDKSHRRERSNLLSNALKKVGGGHQQFPSDLEPWIESDYTPDILPVFPVLRVKDDTFIDRREIEGVRATQFLINSYVTGNRPTPLNIAVFGPPGAGKSTAVNAVLSSLNLPDVQFERLTFNLSSMDDPSGLEDCFTRVQEAYLGGKFPVVFWDEFDTSLGGKKLGWLPYFIGPMEDGVFGTRNRQRRLPRCVFVFAGSTCDSYEGFHRCFEQYAEQGVSSVHRGLPYKDEDWTSNKATDFKSRLTGALDVFGVDPREPSADGVLGISGDPVGYLFRRALVLRSCLKRTFDDYFFNEEGVLRIDQGLAEAFILVPSYFHGARSIRQIVSQSTKGNADVYNASCLPPSSTLRLHVDPYYFEWYYGAYPGYRQDYVNFEPPVPRAGQLHSVQAIAADAGRRKLRYAHSR